MAKKILVVDDLSSVRETLNDFLSLQGYEVVEAENGFDALVHITGTGNGFKLIITDLTMPKVNGYELIEKIKNVLGLPVPIILISSLQQKKEIEMMKSLEKKGWIVAFFNKPLDLQALTEKIKETIK